MPVHVYIITVNYNNPNDTIDFLNKIEASVSVSFSCIVVDNSSDTTAQLAVRNVIKQKAESGNQVYCTAESNVEPGRLLKSAYTHITCINRGFAAANNVALRSIMADTDFAGSDYVFLVNNDTIIEKDCLHKLLRTAQAGKGKTGIVAPLIYYYDKQKIWSAGGWFNKTSGLLHAHDKGKTNFTSGHKRINFLTGCAWLMEIDTLRKHAGLLDEGYFMYYEDLDYSLHLVAQGLELVLVPDAIIRHKVGASSSGEVTAFSAYWMMRGRVRTLRKHSSSVSFWSSILILIISRVFFVFPVACLQGKFFIIQKQMEGFWHEWFKPSLQPETHN